MKNRGSLVLMATMLAVSFAASAAEPLKYKGVFQGNKMRIEGSSNIHPWHSESVFISGNLNLDPKFPTDPASKDLQPGKIEGDGKIAIVVATFKCSSGSAMDAVMQNALDAKNHRRIEFTLKDLVFKEFKNDAMLFDATGDLTCKGTTKTVTLPIEIVRKDAKTLKITGTGDLKMTDFGVEPPAPKVALGFIKTEDEVKLKFEWTVQQVEGRS